MRVLILNGPNLHLLGHREPGVYGTATLAEIMGQAQAHARRMGVRVDWCQTNEEGELVTRIGASRGTYAGLILNPAAYTHTSVAIRDALQAIDIPCVEVHLSNVYAREEFRRQSLTAAACIGQIAGFGGLSYILALEALVSYLGPHGDGRRRVSGSLRRGVPSGDGRSERRRAASHMAGVKPQPARRLRQPASAKQRAQP